MIKALLAGADLGGGNCSLAARLHISEEPLKRTNLGAANPLLTHYWKNVWGIHAGERSHAKDDRK